MLKQCPRCKNEDIKENQNYCSVCGVKLKKIKIAPEISTQEQRIKNMLYKFLVYIFILSILHTSSTIISIISAREQKCYSELYYKNLQKIIKIIEKY